MKKPARISFAPFNRSLRARLILSTTLVTFLAVIAVGFYAFLRSQQSDAYLTNRLDSNIREQAREQLLAASTEQSQVLNNFFTAAHKDTLSFGSSAARLLSLQATFSQNPYWDASTSLVRLPDGSWDNSNNEPGSVFMPAASQLTETVVPELNTLKQLDFIAPTLLTSNPDAVAVYFGGTAGETLYYPNIDLAAVVPPDFDVTQRPWFVNASPAQNPEHQAVWSSPYLDAARNGLIVTNSAPVFDDRGNFRGVVAIDIQLTQISDVVSSIHIGETGYAFLVDKDNRLIAMPDQGYKDFNTTADSMPLGETLDEAKFSAVMPAGFWNALNQVGPDPDQVSLLSFNGQDRFAIIRTVPEVGYDLVIIVPSNELLAPSVTALREIRQTEQNTLKTSVFIVLAILLVSSLITLGIGNRLTNPLRALTQTAQEISGGNFQARAIISGRDEISTLASAFNSMTSRLQDMLQGLEQRVTERTNELKQANQRIEARATQFEAITRVTRAISSERSLDKLLPLITSLVNEYFGYYHIGIFLNDENREYAVLVATNSDGGHKMLERGHQLKIGEQGIVGYVTARGEARLARNVGKDVAYFNNPDLPETKSEAALPLHAANAVAGALDVQSTNEDAFSQEDMNILAVLADQISLAIENARLFETTRRSLTEAETLYRQYLREAWMRLPREEQITGFRYTPRGATPLQGPVTSQLNSDNTASDARMVIPINLRGETIGNLIVQAPKGRQWTDDQIDLIQAAADRVALAAENARLFEETSRRAERERLVSEITTKIRSTNDPEEMIRTALDELKGALGATRVQVIPQVVGHEKNQEDHNSAKRGNGAKK